MTQCFLVKNNNGEGLKLVKTIGSANNGNTDSASLTYTFTSNYKHVLVLTCRSNVNSGFTDCGATFDGRHTLIKNMGNGGSSGISIMEISGEIKV